jgi:Cytochrome C assembly protein
MFQLEAKIDSWRKSMADALGDRPALLDELECHLREDVAESVRAGSPPEQAWDAAVARLGSPAQLAGEFGKLRTSRWLPARLAFLALALVGAVMALFLGSGLVNERVRPLLAVHVFTVTVGYAAGLGIGALAAWALLARAGFGWDSTRACALRSAAARLALISVAMTLVGVVLGAVWGRHYLGRYWTWDLREVGGLAVLVWGCLLVWWLRRGRTIGVAGMVVAVMGNAVVALSWFGPPLVTKLGYGAAPWAHGLLLGAFIVAQLLVASAALLPAGRLTERRRA